MLPQLFFLIATAIAIIVTIFYCFYNFCRYYSIIVAITSIIVIVTASFIYNCYFYIVVWRKILFNNTYTRTFLSMNYLLALKFNLTMKRRDKYLELSILSQVAQ